MNDSAQVLLTDGFEIQEDLSMESNWNAHSHWHLVSADVTMGLSSEESRGRL